MKKKSLYVVLLAAVIYLPASSRECAKVNGAAIVKLLQTIPVKAAVTTEESGSLPVSPAGRLPVNM